MSFSGLIRSVVGLPKLLVGLQLKRRYNTEKVVKVRALDRSIIRQRIMAKHLFQRERANLYLSVDPFLYRPPPSQLTHLTPCSSLLISIDDKDTFITEAGICMVWFVLTIWRTGYASWAFVLKLSKHQIVNGWQVVRYYINCFIHILFALTTFKRQKRYGILSIKGINYIIHYFNRHI